ncbi:MAG: AMP-binding protein [Alphaproteobacteria bacterium]|nr:AMP-binding protein [Alphaproteobacteria bacterium]
MPLPQTGAATSCRRLSQDDMFPPGKRKIGSPGIAFGDEVAIIDRTGHVRGPGQAGEIAVKGPNVMLGYLDDGEATRDTFTKDGWLKTGDTGFMDGDGYVHVSGRLKELIIKGGENIAPREVDDALHAHPEVIEAAAFARPCPDYDQRVEAAVCLAKDATVTADELITHCRTRLGAYRAPERIHVVADPPRGPSGKV